MAPAVVDLAACPSATTVTSLRICKHEERWMRAGYEKKNVIFGAAISSCFRFL